MFSKAHRGDAAAAEPVTPVDVAEQQRALQLVLQVVSQDFWLPAARAVRRMPEREGVCGGLNEYCLGLSGAELLGMVRRARQSVLLQLLQPARLSGLQQHEWDAEDLATTATATATATATEAEVEAAAASRTLQGDAAVASSTAAVGAPWLAPWVAPPLPIAAAAHAFGAEGPSVGTLLRAVDAVLGLPEYGAGGAAGGAVGGAAEDAAAAQRAPGGGAPISVAELKMGHELHRFWVSALAAMSKEGLGEDAAVATQLLRALRARIDAEIDEVAARAAWPFAAGMGDVAEPGPAPVMAPAALRQAVHAHYSALQHLLGLWGRGVEVPGLS